MNQKNIMMIHHGRCGSTVTGNLLAQNPNIHWAGEIYLPIIQEWQKKNPENKLHNKIMKNPIEHLINSMNNCKTHCFGCEISPFNFALMTTSIEKFFNESYNLNFTYFILLRRKNLLRQIVSLIIAKQSTIWNIDTRIIGRLKSIIRFFISYFLINKRRFYKTQASQSKKISLLPSLQPRLPLEKIIKRFELQMQAIENILAGKNILHLNYEDDIEQDPKKAYLRICKFIDVQPTTVSVNYKKMNPFPLADMIEDFDEVRAALHNTPYEWMLDS